MARQVTDNHKIPDLPVPAFLLYALALAEPADCTCCAGSVEGAWEDLCPACAVGILNRTRGEGHPHAPSAAQRKIIDASGLSGGGVYVGDQDA